MNDGQCALEWTWLEMTQALDFYFQICWINEKELSNLITDSSSFRDRICRALENPSFDRSGILQ